jgi:ubiquinone/menaquinone biosynthesis C-methylase UbiE
VDTRTFYDRISATYDLLANAGESACRDHGLSALNASPGERVLEVGFGTGHALAALAAAVGPTGHVYGIDVSPGMLGVARRTVARAGVVNVGLALDDARSLCFRNATFDAVFMSFTLELFTFIDIPIVLAEIERVLRPAGRLAVVAMDDATHPTTMTDVYLWLHGHFPHFVDCRPIKVIDLLEGAGFHTTREQKMSIWGLAVACVVASRRPECVSPPR